MGSCATPVPEPARRRRVDVPLPEEIQVEVTAACNLRCHMCLVRYEPPVDRVRGSISVERFRQVIDELPRLRKVTLQGLGEPLLAPGLVEMVALAASRGAAVGFNTNGTILTVRKAVELIDAGLSWLHVSLDGATAPTYEAIRDGASFGRVVRNVRRLIDLRRERGLDQPRVWLVFVAMRRNVAELPDLVRLASELGVDGVRVQNLAHAFSDHDPAGRYDAIRAYTAAEALWLDPPGDAPDDGSGVAGSSGDVRRVFAEARRVADELAVELRLPDDPDGAGEADGAAGADEASEASGADDAGAAARGCDWPWRATYVTAAGKVQPCCMVMGSERATLGDLDVAPLATVWRSRPYERFRQQLTGPEPPDVCAGCALYRGTF